MSSETLKPCPFCGALPQVTPTYNGGQSVTIPHVHGCAIEELSGVLCDTAEALSKFTAKWNARTDHTALREAVIEECAKVAEEWDELSPYSSRSQAIRALAHIDQAGEAK